MYVGQSIVKKPLTNEHGEVRKLTDEDVETMLSLSKALPHILQRAIGQRGEQR